MFNQDEWTLKDWQIFQVIGLYANIACMIYNFYLMIDEPIFILSKIVFFFILLNAWSAWHCRKRFFIIKEMLKDDRDSYEIQTVDEHMKELKMRCRN